MKNKNWYRVEIENADDVNAPKIGWIEGRTEAHVRARALEAYRRGVVDPIINAVVLLSGQAEARSQYDSHVALQRS